MFKLTEKGIAERDRMEQKYYAELGVLRKEKNDPEYLEGWCIIDTDKYIKTLDDEIALLVYGYDDDVLDTISEWNDLYGDEPIYEEYTPKDLISIISRRGLVQYVDKESEVR